MINEKEMDEIIIAVDDTYKEMIQEFIEEFYAGREYKLPPEVMNGKEQPL